MFQVLAEVGGKIKTDYFSPQDVSYFSCSLFSPSLSLLRKPYIPERVMKGSQNISLSFTIRSSSPAGMRLLRYKHKQQNKDSVCSPESDTSMCHTEEIGLFVAVSCNFVLWLPVNTALLTLLINNDRMIFINNLITLLKVNICAVSESCRHASCAKIKRTSLLK